jgi:hypothetical protein
LHGINIVLLLICSSVMTGSGGRQAEENTAACQFEVLCHRKQVDVRASLHALRKLALRCN